MAVVKADGYGHGMVPAARAALAGGATWLGTGTVAEQADVLAAIRADVDVSVSNTWQLAIVADAAREADRVARVHLKVDTGLSRNGAYPTEWPGLVKAAAETETVAAVGVWSHFAC